MKKNKKIIIGSSKLYLLWQLPLLDKIKDLLFDSHDLHWPTKIASTHKFLGSK